MRTAAMRVKSVLQRLIGAEAPRLDLLDPKARTLYRRMRMAFPPNFPGRTIGLWCLVRYCKEAGLRGDVVECGVGRGVSYYVLGWAMDAVGYDGQLHGFDSFQGFPRPSLEDVSPRSPLEGQWSDTSSTHVRDHFSENGMGEFFAERCRLHAGFFEATLRDPLPVAAISLLHVDVDLYESHTVCCEKLVPLVVPGGVILLDDYAQPNWPGATQAINEMLEATDQTLFRSALMGKYFCLARESASTPAKPVCDLLGLLQAEPAALVRLATTQALAIGNHYNATAASS